MRVIRVTPEVPANVQAEAGARLAVLFSDLAYQVQIVLTEDAARETARLLTAHVMDHEALAQGEPVLAVEVRPPGAAPDAGLLVITTRTQTVAFPLDGLMLRQLAAAAKDALPPGQGG